MGFIPKAAVSNLKIIKIIVIMASNIWHIGKGGKVITLELGANAMVVSLKDKAGRSDEVNILL